MKRCPECRKDYLDDSLMYCLDDGAPLVQGSVATEPATAVLSSGVLVGDKPTALLGGTAPTDDEVRSESRSGSGMLRSRLPWVITGVVTIALAAVVIFGVYVRRPLTEAAVVRFSIPLPEKATPYIDVETHNLSISPDGKRIAFIANYEGEHKLWLRPLDAVDAQVLPGTEGAYSPFWSPDSRYIGFFTGGKLKRIDPSGTSAQTICDLPGELQTSGTWGRDGVILYTDGFINDGETIYRVAATGGAPTPIKQSKKSRSYWVHFLPDGLHFLLYQYSEEDPSARGIYIGALDSPETKMLVPIPTETLSRMEYAAGYLLYAREGSLLAQAFDAKSLQLSGEPFTVDEHLPYFLTGWAEFSVSENGVLAYLNKRPPLRLVWLDRSGREIGQVGGSAFYDRPRLSPDGQRLALTIEDERNGTGDIWIHDLARNTPTRFAFGPTDDSNAVWSPDGHRLAYFSCCDGSTLHIKDVGDTGKGETPLEQGFQVPLDWSPDGRFILFLQRNGTTTKGDVWVLPMQGDDRKPFAFLQTPFTETQARFSPDGHWVAFISNETGRDEVYVTRFDRPGEKWRVSTGGGTSPCWRRDGKELFFLAADRSLMAVTVKTGDAFESAAPAALFRSDSIDEEKFDVTADGQRFVVISNAALTQPVPFTVVVNWASDLKR
jgi:Tol biopolymer transport system component